MHTSRGCSKDHTHKKSVNVLENLQVVTAISLPSLPGWAKKTKHVEKIQIDFKQRKTKTSRKQEVMSGIKPWHTLCVWKHFP